MREFLVSRFNKEDRSFRQPYGFCGCAATRTVMVFFFFLVESGRSLAASDGKGRKALCASGGRRGRVTGPQPFQVNLPSGAGIIFSLCLHSIQWPRHDYNTMQT